MRSSGSELGLGGMEGASLFQAAEMKYTPKRIKRQSQQGAGLLGVGEGDVGTETDHAESRSHALVATELSTGFELAFDRNGQAHNEQISGGVECDGECAENGELEEDSAVLGSDELRDEGEEEESGFRIEDFSENALAKRALRWSKNTSYKFGIPGTDHADAKENEVGGTGELDGMKGDGGGRKDRGDTGGGGEDMDEAAGKGAEGGEDSFAAPTGQAAGQDIENARTGTDSEDQSSDKERKEMMGVRHENRLPGD
jgi:hypothetical protein